MRLLEKHEIDQQKAQEQKREVDEGKKLARRVDELRRLETDEKAHLTAWRDATLAEILQELKTETSRRDALKAESVLLEKRNAKLRESLDAEWETVTQEKETIEALKQDWYLKNANLNSREEQVLKDERSLEAEKGRIEDLKHSTAEKLAQADATLVSAREEAADMRNKAHTTLLEAELKGIDLTRREVSIAVRERDVDNRQQNNEKEALRLTIERRRLQDLAKTLERASQRIYGKR